MIQKIVLSGDPILKRISKPVGKIDKKIISLIQDLKDTLKIQKNPEGVGLAAPQIGKNLRVFYARYKGFERIVINPEIIKIVKKLPTKSSRLKANKGEILEGCLSLPNYYGPLKRAQEVTLKYINEDGKDVIETFKGFHAQIILHEIDHLNGIMFVERLLEQKKRLYELNPNNEWEEIEI